MNIAVIGAGASGLYCGGFLAKYGHQVTIFEKNENVGKKLFITGNGRCNVTNLCEREEFLNHVVRNGKFLYGALKTHEPKHTMEFFQNRGVKMKVEEGGRVFPKSDKAEDVIACLLGFCKENQVDIHCKETVLEVLQANGQIKGIKTNQKTYTFDVVVLATGGMSYASTGSTGDGYHFAKTCGHTIIKPEPSLVGLEVLGKMCKELMGFSLNDVDVSLLEKRKTILKEKGNILFTHFGLSAPTILKMSAHIQEEKATDYTISLDAQPEIQTEDMNHFLLQLFQEQPKKQISTILNTHIPQKLVPYMLEKAEIRSDCKANEITKQQRKNLSQQLKQFEFPVTKKRPFAEAVVTRGGVLLKEVNPKTMESKKTKGLYLIGEVLDLDAYTGGFNLQIAWSTAFAMAVSLKNVEIRSDCKANEITKQQRKNLSQQLKQFEFPVTKNDHLRK